MEMRTLKQVCEYLGISRRAIQGYEKAGLVKATGANKYGHLLYDEAAVRRIEEIRLIWQLGVPVKCIGEIIDGPEEVRRAAVREGIRRTREEIKEKEALIARAEAYAAGML